MDLVRPTTIVDSNLSSTNLVEDDAAAYNAAVTYATGQQCIVVATHKVYESVAGGNVGNYPPSNLPDTTNKWLEVGSTRPWRMFDTQLSTLSTNTDTIQVAVTPGQTDTVALFNVSPGTVTIVGKVGAVEVFTESKDTLHENVFDWYEYFTEPIINKTDILFTDLPLYSGVEITLTIDSTGITAECGHVVFGQKRFIGETQWQPKVGIIDYSRKEEDAYGNPILVQRGFRRRVTVELFLDNSLFDEVDRILTEYRSTAAFWLNSETRTSLNIFGFFRDFELVLESWGGSRCALELESLT